MRYIYSLAFAAFMLVGVSSAEAISPKGKDFYVSAFVGTGFLTHDQSWRTGTEIGTDNRVDVASDAGWQIGGALGGWINGAQRMELAVGYRSNSIDLTGKINASGDVNVIPIMFNNFFYPLLGIDAIPAVARNMYFGFGVGVGLWSFDVPGFDDEFGNTVSAMLAGNVGYDFYLSDLSEYGMALPSALDAMSVGVDYSFVWANPKPNGTFGTAAFANERLQQRTHTILVTARYEF